MTMAQFGRELLHVLFELAPWLLLGALVAGLLHVLLPRDFVRRHLGGRNGVLKASLLGVPLPLCSCSVIPTGLSLRRDGASPGASVGFLISTPQTGVDSVLVSASFLGWPFAVFKLASALVMGLVGGHLTDAVVPRSAGKPSETSDPASSPAPVRPWSLAGAKAIASHGIEMLQTIWGWLVVGILASAIISTLVPPGALQPTGASGGWLATLGVLAISIPLYVCATASVPIAAALVASGLPPSAALVFLMAGPATNVATIGAIYRSLGLRASAVYLGTIVVGSVGLGLAFDSLLANPTAAAVGHSHHTGAVAWAAAAVLVGLLGWFAVADLRHWIGTWRRDSTRDALTVHVEGMTCHGCARKLETTLRGVSGVATATVVLDEKQATVTGDVEPPRLIAAIESAGYRGTLS
ncbi:MAG: hypothetical protein B7733_13830 [Myxococcales bacterium FL481]|nr:MAG: hypothetical protein B7733_13830 [Myxococcales bacterium FL481]